MTPKVSGWCPRGPKIDGHLGDTTEAKAKNKILSTVQDKTQSLFEFYKSKSIPAIFELNKGNHFTEAALRTAKGIKWILEH